MCMLTGLQRLVVEHRCIQTLSETLQTLERELRKEIMQKQNKKTLELQKE